VAEAVDWAVEHGAHVITMSLGGFFSFSMQRALRRAVQADVIVLAAAGNRVGMVVWPARFDECIAVAGVDARGVKWRGSCSGSAVEISAPGSTTDACSRPAATSHPSNSRQPTTVNTPPSPRPATHNYKSPDMPGASTCRAWGACASI